MQNIVHEGSGLLRVIRALAVRAGHFAIGLSRPSRARPGVRGARASLGQRRTELLLACLDRAPRGLLLRAAPLGAGLAGGTGLEGRVRLGGAEAVP
eukprot:186945-Lingulodinium_polyedra.AAC.1